MTSTTVQLMINLNDRLLIEQIETDRHTERERERERENCEYGQSIEKG